ncbi:class I SAM-dependent methyltransferase [Catenovulum agarivorans]|uniref:class I SAM-dependent methyltransferase n=1 Tax=Catenovulum agarivorans TaxID=1172192 RepID=UPI001ED8C3E9|nr:class I SAM-dependent methyltransferase [Catenovulum agarivorans]
MLETIVLVAQNNIVVVASDGQQQPRLTALAQTYGLTIVEQTSDDLHLLWLEDKLQLVQQSQPKQAGVLVDFLGAAATYRRKQVSIKNEIIARAVGCKNNERPLVLDATAGLGRDSLVLASVGCAVVMLERNNAVAALLADGLTRLQLASQDAWINNFIGLYHGSLISDCFDWQNTLPQVDVVYLDPMYPHKKKSAAVKKEMKAFQGFVGADEDSDQLLSVAKRVAQQRVVVKRPDYADYLNQQKPDFSLESKKHRFDVYLT